METIEKVRDREDALASTRDACATRREISTHFHLNRQEMINHVGAAIWIAPGRLGAAV